MTSALDMLKLRLGQPGQSIPQVMPSPEVLAALAERQRAWQLQTPSYGEGEVIPGPSNPLMEQEFAAGAFRGPQREEELMRQLYGGRELAREGVWPMPEGAVQSYSPNSPLSSPLNQMLQRPPFGLY